MDIKIKVRKKGTVQVVLNETGSFHIFDGKGELVQRYDDFDTANAAVWLLERSAEGGPFTVKEIRG